MSKKYFMSLSLVGLFLMMSHPLLAQENLETAAPPALKKVMLGLDANMQMITHAISLEDWALAEKNALAIADHPKPAMADRMRIMKFFGFKMRTFKGHDMKTHQSAMDLSEAAAKKEGAAVIAEFGRLQSACLGCHQEFRDQFKAHFYQ